MDTSPTATPTPHDDDPWSDVADLVMSIAREIQVRGFGDARAVELSGSETNVMRFIDRNPGLGAGDVAQGTGLQRSNLSSALRSLEAKGLVERRHGEDDHRTVLLFPTSLAAQNLSVIRAEWSLMLRQAVESTTGISPSPALAFLADLERGLVTARRR